ncbi:PREDICTED: uncharacterized protein LOC101291558 [Fragaria vesca subsp. vesca]
MASDHTNYSKRFKQGVALDMRSAAPKLMNSDINDLPDDDLLEILYRLSCYKFVAKCKRVCKRWCRLMSEPSFIGGFVSLKNDKQSPIQHSLLDYRGVEFLGRMSSSTKPLTPLFEQLMSFHGLERQPVIVASYNDLILCSTSTFDQRDYYICNPSTVQWCPLPPPPHVYYYTPVGLICDLPYYDFRPTGNQRGSIFHLNAEYRCRVVRIIYPEDLGTVYSEIKVQIFSSETAEWIETIVSSPLPFHPCDYCHCRSYGNNGMLYWGNHRIIDERFLIGLNPFIIKNSNNTSLYGTSSSSTTIGVDTIDHIQNKCFIGLRQYEEDLHFSTLGVYKGCVRIFEYDTEMRNLYIVDLNDKEIHEGGVCLNQMRVYNLNEEMVPIDKDDIEVAILGFDPDNDDVLYLVRGVDILKWNIRTRTWSTVAEVNQVSGGLYPLAIPWWPTPVPKLK